MVNEKWSIISLHSTVISAESVVYPEIEEFIISLVKQPDKVVGFSSQAMLYKIKYLMYHIIWWIGS